MDRLRTPEERFAALPDFSYVPRYAEVADPSGGSALRMAYLDEGPRGGNVVILLHGEPTWSFLYRLMIPGLLDADCRVVAPDLIGFGRSDKPTPRTEYTYARQVEWTRELLFDHLDLSAATLFGQDWGSLVGLRLVAEHPERFAGVAIANGGLPTGDEPVSDAFRDWRDYSQNAPELRIGRIVAGGCVAPPPDEVIAAYDAPFPDESYKEGAREFPRLVPTSPDDPAHDANVAAWEVLATFDKPFLTCFSDGDPVTRGADRRFLRVVPGTVGQPHVVLRGAGHFVQEEKGAELAAILSAFVASNQK